MKTYVTIADTVAARIQSGDLRVGEKLPSQRIFAYDNGIASSTAGRVYAELVKRGLITGEVGRGSYVLAPPTPKDISAVLEARSDMPLDLETSFPIIENQSKLMAPALQELSRPDALDGAMRPARSRGNNELQNHGNIASQYLGYDDWKPDASSILFTGSGRQAIGTAITALVPVGGRLGVEAFTYPILKGFAANLGRDLVPVAMDDEGLMPDAVRHAHQSRSIDAVYVQPSLHNPTGRTMSLLRRQQIAKVAREFDLPTIEDQVYRFLMKDKLPPIARFAPDQIILLDSLSKRLAPGLSVGFLAAAKHHAAKLSVVMSQCGWAAPTFAIEATTRWISDGIIEQLDKLKQAEIAKRWVIAHAILDPYLETPSTQACHLWLQLPKHWQCDNFVTAAAIQGIAIAPGTAFAVQRPSNHVRISLVSVSQDNLKVALGKLRAILDEGS
ncbi:PLP-dependent aminotransferase family protein [Cohaesibacter gelatinilyticus]|uniref:DNA-binding transcriptional regulator, MocR family, contains an aminotransferase domain n=1 Tax=Cohaesibacter gelatinilyticus TaxID=372072 RepID=A0A285PBS1_9HYPH|nr:PLP-dependent aminotransferase family protein [Cohaesibacter gelatinilyticus]SNZ19182.1 DNA-binding transcriptional regulator, MocR family, contains an aminotransferase domain [Cohaesibacter gelatinilyticus]